MIINSRIYYISLTVVVFLISFIVIADIAHSASVLSTHPDNNYTGMPTYLPISVRVSGPLDPDTVNFSLNPSVEGTVSYNDQCDILSYYYIGSNPIYRSLDRCYSLVFTPSVDLAPGTTYTPTVSGGGIASPYSWFFTTGNYEVVGGETTVKTYSYPSSHKPSVGINSKGEYVVVWQDINKGIRAQRFDSYGRPTGSEISITSNVYYSRRFGPSVAMNNNGEFVVGWMNDFPDDQPANIYYYVRKFTNLGSNLGGSDIWVPVPSYLYSHADSYQTEFSMGGPAVGINSDGKKFIIVFQAPVCHGGCDDLTCKYPAYQCDNYIFGWLLDGSSGRYSGQWVGDTDETYSAGNGWASIYDTPIINDPPFWGDGGGGCGGKGSAYERLSSISKYGA